jgi:hypothetical protein
MDCKAMRKNDAANGAKPFARCPDCGMTLDGPSDYHPYAACVMFRQLGQTEKVEDLLLTIVKYGARCQEQGIDIKTAMRDVTALHHAEAEAAFRKWNRYTWKRVKKQKRVKRKRS